MLFQGEHQTKSLACSLLPCKTGQTLLISSALNVFHEGDITTTSGQSGTLIKLFLITFWFCAVSGFVFLFVLGFFYIPPPLLSDLHSFSWCWYTWHEQEFPVHKSRIMMLISTRHSSWLQEITLYGTCLQTTNEILSPFQYCQHRSPAPFYHFVLLFSSYVPKTFFTFLLCIQSICLHYF